jgi:hypothetical protein
MKLLVESHPESTPQRHARCQGHARLVMGLLVCFFLGVGVTALLFSRLARSPDAVRNPVPSGLSDGTRAVLSRLESPVELRWYALLDPATVTPSLKAFAERAEVLLGEYQKEGNGKILLTRHTSSSSGAADKASADGLKPFNLEKGAACFLGIAVVQGGARESLARLLPEWEPALESDLTRAIVRVTTPPPAAPVSAETVKIQADADEQIRRVIPNLASVSVQEGTKVLRKAAMEEFNVAVQAAETKLKEAEEQVLAAQSKSDAEQAAARKNLQQVQADRSEKLKEIAARLQNQIEALQRLKAGEPSSPSAK